MDPKLCIPAYLCYNQPDLTRAMYQQLGRNSCIIDNGSRKPQAAGGPISLVLRIQKTSFTGAWNKAMRSIHELGYEWVWMLNNDVYGVSQEMFRELQQIIETIGDPDLMALSPAYNSPHAHMNLQNGNSLWRKESWLDWAGPVVNTEKFLSLGGFDTKFEGYGCDIDLCLRARKRGYTFYVTDGWSFQHQGGATAIGEGNSRHIDLELMNSVFEEKYGVRDIGGMLTLFP